ncbi:putative membrane protein [Burkholderiales bacterium JOSHI_001]|nr:putative membrane protein [Burkholderiales bacterium JOSHI_001]
MEFHDTIPTDFSVDSRMQEPLVQRLEVAFTGSGSEYFRIWIVNLLLSIVTLTLYTPFARARRLAYFYANTRVGGHALGFHGNPWKMLRGYLLVAGLGAAYAVALRLAPLAAGAAVLLFAALWPALWRASLQFRLGNTSWRGLRFAFDGDLASAYRAVLPIYLPAAVVMAVLAALPAAEPGQQAGLPGALAALVGLLGLLAPLLYPLGLAWMKRYQHGGFRYASEATRLDAGAGTFYLIALNTVLVAVAGFALGLALLWLMGSDVAKLGLPQRAPSMLGMLLTLALVAAVYLLMFALVWPYYTVQLQNRVWNATVSHRLKFESDLRFVPYMALSALNFGLTLFTLGLYRPFAAVAAARMRVEAISVQVRGDVDGWLARAQQQAAGTTGDAAGDFFGIDLGL